MAKTKAEESTAGEQRYKVVCPGATRIPYKTGPFYLLEEGTVISTNDFPANVISSLNDNKMIAPYEGDEPTAPLKLDDRVVAPVAGAGA